MLPENGLEREFFLSLFEMDRQLAAKVKEFDKASKGMKLPEKVKRVKAK